MLFEVLLCGMSHYCADYLTAIRLQNGGIVADRIAGGFDLMVGQMFIENRSQLRVENGHYGGLHLRRTGARGRISKRTLVFC